MEVKIYQINSERDQNDAAFLSYKNLPENGIDVSSYDKVYDGSIQAEGLEHLYTIFNVAKPEGYPGRSMSVSDVIAVKEHGKDRFYFVDSIGFKKIDFDPSKTKDRSDPIDQKMTVVMLEPGKPARIESIDRGLESMQKTVGGDIEILYPFDDAACLVCCETGKIDGMPLNRALKDYDDNIYDIVAGKCFICSVDGENLGGLPPQMQKEYKEMFKHPEMFVKVGEDIKAIPIPESKAKRR